MLEGSAKAGQIIKAVKIIPGDTGSREGKNLCFLTVPTQPGPAARSDKFMTEMIIWPEGELAGERRQGRDHPVWAC